jgi:adenylate kinase
MPGETPTAASTDTAARTGGALYLVLLGPPGTGKGTQAKRVAGKLGVLHIATGDLFREAVREGTELGTRAKAFMDKGELVPDEITIGMLLERIAQRDAEQGVLFDGFPRNLAQALALEEALAQKEKRIAGAVLITASDDEIVRRLSGRWSCPQCGAIYHEQSQPPAQPGVCDRCGSALAQRDDDKAEVVRERLARQRPPADLLDHYRRTGTLREVDGERDLDAVTGDLLGAISQLREGAPA